MCAPLHICLRSAAYREWYEQIVLTRAKFESTRARKYNTGRARPLCSVGSASTSTVQHATCMLYDVARTCKCAQNMHHQHRSPPSSCSAAQHSTAAHMPCALCEHHGCASRCITARRRVRHDRAASGAAMDRRGQTSKTRRLELFWGSYSSIGHARWMETERGGRPRGAQVVVGAIDFRGGRDACVHVRPCASVWVR